MRYYAHSLIEDPRDGSRYHPGDELPAGLPGVDELADSGAAGATKPDVVDSPAGPIIAGDDSGRHVTTGDSAASEEATR